MDEVKIYKFDKVYSGRIMVQWDGRITKERQELRTRYTKHGWAAFIVDPNSWRSVNEVLGYKCLSRHVHVSPTAYQKLYFSPHCRMRRDLFRNAGYIITMNPDNADLIVVPYIRPMEQMRGHIIIWEPDTKELTFYTMDRDDIPQGEPERHMLFDQIVEHFSGKNVEFVFGNLTINDHAGYFMPKYDAYEQILTDDSGARRYVEETTFRLNPPLEISVDTLHLWSKIYDDDVLADAICNSDWIDYPATLLVFLYIEHPRINVNNSTFSLVLNKIGFDRSYTISGMLNGRIIQPKDWNMLQDYFMHKCELPEEGGVIKNLKNIRDDVRNMMRCATMIKPKKIEVPMAYNQLCDITA